MNARDRRELVVRFFQLAEAPLIGELSPVKVQVFGFAPVGSLRNNRGADQPEFLYQLQ